MLPIRTINEIFRTIPRKPPTPLPCSLLPLHLILPSPQPLQKDNNPSPRTTSLPPLSKVRCCRPKKFGRLPEGLLYTHQPLNPHNLLKSATPSLPVPTLLPFNERSICFASALSLSFRKASVCVCLVGFASLQSPWAHTLKASLPCLPLPLHRTSLSPQPSQKDNNLRPTPPHLPPLSKVRCCRPKKFGRLPEGLLYTHQPFQNRTITCFAPSHLPPSSKANVCCPKKIRATTGWIAPYPHHQ